MILCYHFNNVTYVRMFLNVGLSYVFRLFWFKLVLCFFLGHRFLFRWGFVHFVSDLYHWTNTIRYQMPIIKTHWECNLDKLYYMLTKKRQIVLYTQLVVLKDLNSNNQCSMKCLIINPNEHKRLPLFTFQSNVIY